MSVPAITRDQAREFDRRAVEELGIPSIVLMENAGRGVADKLCELGINGPVVICCGAGNNGGDGFVIARHLDLRGIAVKIFAWGWRSKLAGGQRPPGPTDDARTNLEIIQRLKLPLAHDPDPETLRNEFASATWIVDALLGTGARGEPRPPLDSVIDLLNASQRPIMAVDVPSGLDCDTGQPAVHTVRAAHTCTFVASKTGFLIPAAPPFTGKIHVLDIGLHVS